MVLVSVVIPTYNEEEDIGECLKSLKEQTLKDKEVIVVDDGSTDRTLEKVKKYKVKVLRQKHGGPGLARNLGAKKARGEILVFVDADMHFPKNYIENLVKPIIKDKAGKVLGTTHDYEIATNLRSPYSRLWGEVRVNKKSARDVKIFRAIRKDKFLELGGFDPKYGYADDQTLWYKYRIKPVVAENTVCYHKNPDTLEATYKQAKWIGKSWKERYEIFRVPVIKNLAILALKIATPPIILIKAIKKIENTNLKERKKFYETKLKGYLEGLTIKNS